MSLSVQPSGATKIRIPRGYKQPKLQKFFKGLGAKVRKIQKTRLAKRTAKLKRTEKYLGQKAKNLELANKNRQMKYDAKIKSIQQKAMMRDLKLNDNAHRGGIKGSMARRLQTKIAKGDAEVEMAKLEPKLSSKERLTRVETEASIKKTKARGAAAATAISALGAANASKAESDSKAAIAKAEADKAASQALVDSLNSVPKVTVDQYSDGSASGLITGVR